MQDNDMKGLIIFNEGPVFEGKLAGFNREFTTGEAVFNTGMTGYTETFTDPSYAGQIICMTAPMIGNYGVCSQDFESPKIYAKGIVIRELCDDVYEKRSEMTLREFAQKNEIPILYGINTRDVTLYLRNHGSREAIIVPAEIGETKGREILKNNQAYLKTNWAIQVAPKEIKRIETSGAKKTIALFDLGAKQGIIRSIQKRGFHVAVVPGTFSASEILAHKFDGILLANGPGDPALLPGPVKAVQELLGKIPMMGICLGHQLLAQALGLKTYKLRFGHRGPHHPVLDLREERVLITSQNHGFAVEDTNLPKRIRITHRNLFDGTNEGIEDMETGTFSVQFHPEARPGPEDAQYLFDRFLTKLK